MANQITGRILSIGQPVTVASRDPQNPITRRTVVLELKRYDPTTGEPINPDRPNTPELEFSGKAEQALAAFHVGQFVTVSFAVEGTPYTVKETGEQKIFTRLRPYRIEAYGTQQQPAPQQAAPAPQPSPSPSRTVQGGETDGLPF